MIKCKLCGRPPELIAEYIDESRRLKITPSEFVRQEEGTFNHETGLFYCTVCYVKAGMPLGRA